MFNNEDFKNSITYERDGIYYFNTLKNMPYMPYLCISYLMDNNENIWKLLKYTEDDAWKKENLTQEEKADMIFKGVPPETDYRIFFDEGQLDAWTIQATLLRITPVTIIPMNQVQAQLYMSFEVLSHYDINHMSNYSTRTDYIIQQILQTFNGVDIPGIGRFTFDINSFPGCKIVLSGQKPYSGKTLIMGVYYSSDEMLDVNE